MCGLRDRFPLARPAHCDARARSACPLSLRLAVLGQARDPQAVQPHVRKCFEAIKSLDMKEVGIYHVADGKIVREEFFY